MAQVHAALFGSSGTGARQLRIPGPTSGQEIRSDILRHAHAVPEWQTQRLGTAYLLRVLFTNERFTVEAHGLAKGLNRQILGEGGPDHYYNIYIYIYIHIYKILYFYTQLQDGHVLCMHEYLDIVAKRFTSMQQPVDMETCHL